MQIEELTTALSRVGGMPIERLLRNLETVSSKLEKMNDEVWTQTDCTKHLGVSADTLRTWSLKLGLPVHKKGGKAFYIKSEVIDWVAEDEDKEIAEQADAILKRLNSR